MLRLLPYMLLVLLWAPHLQAADWPAFRGPTGDGIAVDDTAPAQWNATENVKWKVPLPQPGNGSPIVSGERVFVASAEDARGHKRSLLCFDRGTGKLLWTKTVAFDRDDPTHETNPYGGTTPAADGERVVVWHGSAGLYCDDFEGRELWHHNLGEFTHMWGYGTSPVIQRDRVILHTGPGRRVFVAAFELASGKELWRQEEPIEGDGQHRPDKAYMGSWATPLVIEHEGRMQAICALPTRVVSYDCESGDILWFCRGLRGPKGDLSYSSPVVSGDLCVAVGGFNGPALGFKLGGSGDITAQATLWRKEQTPQSIGSGVIVDGYFYRPNAGPGTIDCLDPATGEILWSERTGTFWGSLVHVAGRCYVTAQDGTTFVFTPSPKKFELIAKNPLGEASNATPAVSNGELFLRGQKHLYCIGGQ
jgi:outer membrane protein assembly factor BamB